MMEYNLSSVGIKFYFILSFSISVLYTHTYMPHPCCCILWDSLSNLLAYQLTVFSTVLFSSSADILLLTPSILIFMLCCSYFLLQRYPLRSFLFNIYINIFKVLLIWPHILVWTTQSWLYTICFYSLFHLCISHLSSKAFKSLHVLFSLLVSLFLIIFLPWLIQDKHKDLLIQMQESVYFLESSVFTHEHEAFFAFLEVYEPLNFLSSPELLNFWTSVLCGFIPLFQLK